MNRLPYRALAAATLISICSGSLAGCAANNTEYPSLARRPAEQFAENQAIPAPAPSPEPVAPSDPALPGRIASLTQQASDAHDRFLARKPRAATLTASAKGAAVGSEGWSVATVAVAELESARSDAMIALTELDRLYAAARIAGQDASALATARDRVSAKVSEEDRVIAEFAKRLPS